VPLSRSLWFASRCLEVNVIVSPIKTEMNKIIIPESKIIFKYRL
jgi:hypothetical protein